MTKNGKIVLNIESATDGHSTVECRNVQEAITRLEQETTERGRWCYCDGAYTNIDTATEEGRERLAEVLTQAEDIVLTNSLLGG